MSVSPSGSAEHQKALKPRGPPSLSVSQKVNSFPTQLSNIHSTNYERTTVSELIGSLSGGTPVLIRRLCPQAAIEAEPVAFH